MLTKATPFIHYVYYAPASVHILINHIMLATWKIIILHNIQVFTFLDFGSILTEFSFADNIKLIHLFICPILLFFVKISDSKCKLNKIKQIETDPITKTKRMNAGEINATKQKLKNKAKL
jgi:hypothetical protein